MEPIPQAIADYATFLATLKGRIAAARTGAARTINHELIRLYWDTGRGIVERQQSLRWGESVIEELSRDLQREFKGVGFSSRNLRNMKQFFNVYSNPEFWQQVVANLHWAKKIFHRFAFLSAVSESIGGLRIESWPVRTRIRGQNGFLSQSTQR